MSLYNMVCGNNPLFEIFHAIIGQVEPLPEIPRYRDTWTILEGDEPKIVIYTRTGGGNREEYEDSNLVLNHHPLCVGDRDDDFDSTFALFSFKVPEEWKSRVKRIHELWSRTPKGKPGPEKSQMALAAIRGEPANATDLPTDEEFDELSTLIDSAARDLGLVSKEEK